MHAPIEDCWFLTGPTASGKTEVGLALANRLDAEIISLDSMSVYRGMDIGTAKPTPRQQRAVPHHLIDVVDPNQDYSLAAYLAAAEQCVHTIRQRGKEVLFVGGTPLYLKALLRGLSTGPAADWEFRRQVRAEAEQVGVEALHERLRSVDPLSASKLPQGDIRRIIRALEVYKLTGQPISHQQLHFDEGRSAAECKVFVMSWPKDVLLERISHRVTLMFDSGLLDEISGLRTRFLQLSRTASQAVGYREGLDCLDGRCNVEVAMQRVEIRTRRFAKRQRTWFRGLSECRSVECDESQTPQAVAENILQSLSR